VGQRLGGECDPALHGSLARAAGKGKAVLDEPEGLRDERRQVAARLQPAALELVGRVDRKQPGLARRFLAGDVVADDPVGRGGGGRDWAPGAVYDGEQLL